MDPLRGIGAHNVQGALANPAKNAQPTPRTGSSGHVGLLTPALLSSHTADALSAKAAQGDEQEKTLVGLARRAIGGGELHILDIPSKDGVARFATLNNHDVVVIKAKLNERSEYDIMEIGLQRSSETPISMTLPLPITAIRANTTRHASALQHLPDEILLQIAGRSGNSGSGVNLSLRGVSQHLKVIADDQMSPKQQFIIENSKHLETLGLTAWDMRRLADRPNEQRAYILAHGQKLRSLGALPNEMFIYAAMPENARNLIASHGEALQAAGYDLTSMMNLSNFKKNVIDYAVSHCQTLHALGFQSFEITNIALVPKKANFLASHGQALQALGFARVEMERLSNSSENTLEFVFSNGQTLKALGYDATGMEFLARHRSEDQRNFILSHGPTLKAAGFQPRQMTLLATKSEAHQAEVLRQLEPVEADRPNTP